MNKSASQKYTAAISRCVDVLLGKNTSEEQLLKAEALLAILLKNIMPHMRGVCTAVENVENTFKAVYELTNVVGELPSSVFVNVLCEKTKLSNEQALVAVMPALCNAFAEAITEEDVFLYERFERISAVLCKGEEPLGVSKQLAFVNEVFCIESPEFIGDDNCRELTECIMAQSKNDFVPDRRLTEEIVYHIFNKVRLSTVVEQCKQNPTSQNCDLLNELAIKYDLQNGEIFIDDPFYVKKRERLEFVKGLQKYTMQALVLTRNFLQEQGLRFYLAEGTLLGAVRHNGFIPWDDDVDIVMPREDYDKLVKLALAGKIPKELNFDSLETNEKHWVLGAKMQLTKPCEYIQPKVQKLSKCFGPYVDIFPMDYWNEPTGIKYMLASKCVSLARRMLFIKTGYSTKTKKKPLRIFMRLLALFVKNEWIEKFAIKNMKKFYNGNRKYLVNLCSYYPYYKEVFPTSFFGEAVYVDFEGEKMPVPCEYDYILKTVYGRNYDTVPPVKVTNMRNHAFVLREDN